MILLNYLFEANSIQELQFEKISLNNSFLPPDLTEPKSLFRDQFGLVDTKVAGFIKIGSDNDIVKVQSHDL